MDQWNYGGRTPKMHSSREYSGGKRSSASYNPARMEQNFQQYVNAGMYAPVPQTQTGAWGPSNYPNVDAHNGTRGAQDNSFWAKSPAPNMYGGVTWPREMFDTYMRDDMHASYNNPYLFSRACSFSDWMSVQHIYNNYRDFLNYIGESRVPQSSAPFRKTQSVQTQTPVHEFKSALIQTDNDNTPILSDLASDSEINPRPTAKLDGEAVCKIGAALVPESQNYVELTVSTVEDDTSSPSSNISDKASRFANDNYDNSHSQSPDQVPEDIKETCGSNANFLDDDNLIMPIPRSRGRGRTPLNSNDNQSESVPGHKPKNSHCRCLTHLEDYNPITPGAQNEGCSTIPRSRGRGQPHNLKLTVPNPKDLLPQNMNNNALDNSVGTVDSLETKDDGSSSLKREVFQSPTVPVPPGFEGKPPSPPTVFNFNIPVSPTQLLPLGNSLNVAMNTFAYDQTYNQKSADASEVRKQPVSAPPGFSGGCWQKSSIKTAGYTQEEQGHSHSAVQNKLPSWEQNQKLHKQRDKMKLPVFSKMYKAKKTSIQNYLRANLVDNKKRRRGPPLTILEKIEENIEEELVTEDDEQSKLMAKNVEGNAEQNGGQGTLGAEDSYLQNQSGGHLDNSNLIDPCQIDAKTAAQVPSKSNLTKSTEDRKGPRKAYPGSISTTDRTRGPPVGSAPLKELQNLTSEFSHSMKLQEPVELQVPEKENAEDWERAENDVFVLCKWYKKQLLPIFEATGRDPSEC